MAAEFLVRMGERLRERRDEMGLSRAEVARRMPGKVNENQVYRWEQGKHQPNPDTLEALAGVLERPVSYFMAEPADKTETPSPFDAPTEDVVARLARIEAQQSELSDQFAELLAVLTGDPEKTALLGDKLVRMLERAITRLGQEAGRPPRKPRRRPPGEEEQPAA